MIPLVPRRWLAFGAGIGIEICGTQGSETMRVLASRVRPTHARLVSAFTVEDFPHQPAAAWGADYALFLRKHGLAHVSATVVLNREDVIVRTLSMPGVEDKDLDSAVAFQIDGLHPYNEDDVLSSWARLDGSSTVLVAIARKQVIDRYATLFAEAGVKIACLTCSAAALYSARRIPNSASCEILAAEPLSNGKGVEIYGESPAHPVYSAVFDLPLDRATALAASELRLTANPEPDLEPRSFAGIASAPPDTPASASPLAWAAALASACPQLSLTLNLLPSERRQLSSRWRWAPSVALAVIVLGLLGAVAAFPNYESRHYLRSLNDQIALAEPGSRRSQTLDREIAAQYNRTLLLDQVHRQAKSEMDVLAELTKILPSPTWITVLEISPTQVVVQGETDQAAPLLQTIDASPLFKGSEFLMLNKTANGEVFRIRSRREAGK